MRIPSAGVYSEAPVVLEFMGPVTPPGVRAWM